MPRGAYRRVVRWRWGGFFAVSADPILPVTKRHHTAQLGKAFTALLPQVIEIGLRGLERPLTGNA